MLRGKYKGKLVFFKPDGKVRYTIINKNTNSLTDFYNKEMYALLNDKWVTYTIIRSDTYYQIYTTENCIYYRKIELV